MASNDTFTKEYRKGFHTEAKFHLEKAVMTFTFFTLIQFAA